MPKKSATRKRQAVIVNPHQAPTIYSNLCGVSTVGGDLRITFQELLAATATELTSREIMNVYLNQRVATEFARILTEAVGRLNAAAGEKKS